MGSFCPVNGARSDCMAILQVLKRAKPGARPAPSVGVRPIFDTWLQRGQAKARLGQRLHWLICFAGSTLVVLLGIDFGRQFVIPGPWFKAPEPFVESMVHWDGGYFYRIAELGYD